MVTRRQVDTDMDREEIERRAWQRQGLPPVLKQERTPCDVDGSGFVDDDPEATRNHTVESANSGIGVSHGPDSGICTAHDSDGSGSSDGSSGADITSEATRNHAAEGANGDTRVALGTDSGINVAHGSESSGSVDDGGSVDDATEATRNHAAESANDGSGATHGADGVNSAAHGSDGNSRVDGHDDGIVLMRTMASAVRTVAMTVEGWMTVAVLATLPKLQEPRS